MLWTGSSRHAAGLLLAVAGVLSPAAACTKGEGGKCTHDTACDFGLACVFSDVAVIDCCALNPDGSLICDPNNGSVKGLGIASDCEIDANGLLKPKLRRASCLGAVYEDYRSYTGTILLNDDGNAIGPDFQPIGLRDDLTDHCTCEAGANFFESTDPVTGEVFPYDSVLAAPVDMFLCPRGDDNVSIDHPVRIDTNGDGIVTYLDCPPTGEADTCPPCVAFP